MIENKYPNSSLLQTDVLPKYNCSNCKHFQLKKQIFKTDDGELYTYYEECNNFVQPLLDCVLRGFEGHSEQIGFSQTINIKEN